MFWKWIKKVVISREVATFCAFLVVASLMWLMFTIGSQREMVIPAPVAYYGIPDDVKLATPLPDEVTFTVEEEGAQLINYLFTTLDTIKIDLSDQFEKKSSNQVKINYLPYIEEKMNVISTTCNIVSVEPAIYNSSYVKVYTRRVPVVLGSPVRTALQYTLLDSVGIYPKNVLIRGERKVIDTISAIYVDSVPKMFRKDERITARLVRPRNVELLTKSVTLTVKVERLTEKSFTMPIEQANVPKHTSLHLFPKEAVAVFVVGLSRYENIIEEDFHIVLDYEDIDTVHNTCPLKLINNGTEENLEYRIVPSEVEYLIEKI